MKEQINAAMEQYMEEHTDDISPLLVELIRETEKKTGKAYWSIGKIEGIFLQLLVKISNAKNVFEVGTFTGYSALMIAEALPEDGRLVTCEINNEYADIAKQYFNKSPHGYKIRLELNPAHITLGGVAAETMDFVFIDADKPGYRKYYDEGLRILHRGGLIFVDNVFWRQKIFSPKIKNENARAIAALNDKIKQDKRVEKVMLNIRDGVYLIRKL
ncbi:O-methyltransferase [Thermodesulfobacteriota bacterium]